MKTDMFIGHAVLFKHVVDLFLNEKSLRIVRVNLQLASVTSHRFQKFSTINLFSKAKKQTIWQCMRYF